MLTGMGKNALSGHMGWDYKKASAAFDAFLTDAFPEIGDFQKKAAAIFRSRGYVFSILGRRARLESDKLAYVAVSRIIQNSGGEHMKTALLRANQYEDAHPEVNILLSIHDSTIWQRDEGHDPTELIRVIENVAQEPQFNLKVPIPVDVGTGRNWAEASYGK
jgi:DNA polymerase I-like protein with 3'-5' exonuclease and polymerase domains